MCCRKDIAYFNNVIWKKIYYDNIKRNDLCVKYNLKLFYRILESVACYNGYDFLSQFSNL